jgi:uncharacterized phage protein gp47/JayE
MTAYGVTPNGFVKKTIEVLLEEVRQEYRTAFGADIDVSHESPFGQIIGIEANARLDFWNLLEDNYTTRNPNQVSGAAQDDLYSEVGLTRIDRAKSQAPDTLLWGVPSTVIPVNSQASQSTAQKTFALSSEVIISSSSPRGVEFTIATPTTTKTYSFVLDGQTISYAYPATHSATFHLSGPIASGQTVTSVVNGTNIPGVAYTTSHANTMALWGAKIDTTMTALGYNCSYSVSGNDLTITLTGATTISSITAVVTGSGTPAVANYTYAPMGMEDVVAGISAALDAKISSEDIDEAYYVEGDDKIRVYNIGSNFTLASITNLTDSMYASAGTFNCTEYGSFPVPAFSLDTITTPVSGWSEVENPAAGATGREAETDAEFRLRRAQFYAVGKATEDAIRQHILNTVNGVISCIVVSNRTSGTVDSMPPHSLQVIAEGGDEQDIADAIWYAAPAGITIYGTVTGTYVVDSEGYQHEIKFSRPDTDYVWLHINISLYDEEIFPEDGDEQIKAAIVEWSLVNFTPGKDLIPQRLCTPIYTVPGIQNALIYAAVTDATTPAPTYPGDYVTTVLDTLANHFLSFDVSRITVTHV